MNAVSQQIRPQATTEKVLMAGNQQDEAEKGLDEVFAEGKAEECREVVDAGEGNDGEKDNLECQDCKGADARVLPDPGEPTASQIEDHRAFGHVPCRSWFAECVNGRSAGESTLR